MFWPWGCGLHQSIHCNKAPLRLWTITHNYTDWLYCKSIVSWRHKLHVSSNNVTLCCPLFSCSAACMIVLPSRILPAVVDGKTLATVPEFLSVPEGDVHGLLEQQSCGAVKDSCRLQEKLVVFEPGMLCNCWYRWIMPLNNVLHLCF